MTPATMVGAFCLATAILFVFVAFRGSPLHWFGSGDRFSAPDDPVPSAPSSPPQERSADPSKSPVKGSFSVGRRSDGIVVLTMYEDDNPRPCTSLTMNSVAATLLRDELTHALRKTATPATDPSVTEETPA